MTNVQSESLLHAYVSTAELADPEAFEAQRRAAQRAVTEGQSPAFDQLLNAPTVEGVPLVDVVLRQVTDETSEPMRRQDALNLGKRLIDIAVNPDTTEVVGVYALEQLPVDERQLAAQQGMAGRIGWGPKQNRTSFRFNPRRGS